MKPGPTAPPRVAWRRIAGYAVVWLGLLVWGALFRMPYDLRIGVALWSCAAAGLAGLGLGLWKKGGAMVRSRTGKSRWQQLRAILGFGVGAASLVGIPVSGLLIGCNGTFRRAEAYIVEGTVVAKTITGGRSSSYVVTVYLETYRRHQRFSVKRAAFEQIQVGDHYHEVFQVGLFGWPCRS